uniref:Uncharacterized protein n=1 Tax=Panagrolaimus sp. PS1159 TaxID=55785 RepID=A0AC35G7S3_9BILA
MSDQHASRVKQNGLSPSCDLLPIPAVNLNPSGSEVAEPPSQHTSNCEEKTPTTGTRTIATAVQQTTTTETTTPISSSDQTLSMTATTCHSIYCRHTSPKITEIVIDGDNAAEVYFDDKTFIKEITLDAFRTLVTDYQPAEELTVTSNNYRSGWIFLSTDEIRRFLRRCTKVHLTGECNHRTVMVFIHAAAAPNVSITIDVTYNNTTILVDN